MAFYESHVPSLPPHALAASDSDSGDEISSEDNTLSPTQTQGPRTFTPEDISTCLAAGSRARTGLNAPPGKSFPRQKQELESGLAALSSTYFHPRS